MRPSEKLTTASRSSDSASPTSMVWLATSLVPTMPDICLRSFDSKIWAKIDPVLLVTSHIVSRERPAAAPSASGSRSEP